MVITWPSLRHVQATVNKNPNAMILQKPWVSENARRISRISVSLFQQYVRLAVFHQAVLHSRFFARLRKSRSPGLQFVFINDV